MATILIVDDEPLNRELLVAHLDGAGHRLVEAATGERALTLARIEPPDLVLLDVMMPGIDGYETTRRLKERFGNEFVPVVLITALADQEARTRGLTVGADEFLTKPVDAVELRVRTTNLLALRASFQSVRAKEAATARQNAELVELQRFKDEMSALLIHDLKNPLGVMMGNLEYVRDELPELRTDVREALDDSSAAGRRLTRLLANLYDLARIEASQLELHRTLVDVPQILEPIVHQRNVLARSRQIELALALDPEARTEADPDIVTRVVENLLDNSFRHTPRGGRIQVVATTDADRVTIQVGNSGPPIPVEARARIFEKYGQAEGHGRMNLGLGLYFCRLAIETHGGRLRLADDPQLPTVFAIELPSAGRPAHATA